MNEYASLRKFRGFRSGLVMVLVLLLVLEMCSLSVLFGQITSYSTVQQRCVISLTEGSPDGTLEIYQRDELASRQEERYAPVTLTARRGAAPVLLTAETPDPNGDHTHYRVYDANTVWSTHTDVEIFSIRYDDNGDGYYTTASSNTDKVFAPGTTQSYTFTLANNGDKTLGYKMNIVAYYENTDGLWIPIEGRLRDYTGAWLVGGAAEWPDVLNLDGFERSGSLAARHEYDYTIDWRWPFERFDGEGLDANDDYDTMLGNTAVDRNLILHIIINTEAWLDEDNPSPGGHPKTGDAAKPYLWAGMALGSFVLLLVIFYVFYKDERKKRDAA